MDWLLLNNQEAVDRRAVNSSATRGEKSDSMTNMPSSITDLNNSPDLSLGATGYTPLQPITSFSSTSDLTTSVALPGVQSSVNRANIISNSTVIEILLYLLCREREPDQAKREILIKALGKGIQHWNHFLYIPLHSLPGLDDFRKDYLRKFEFLFEEIHSQVQSTMPSFIKNPVLYPTTGIQLTQLDDRYSREFIEISLLGKGGFGSVVKAKSRLDGHTYAIKIILMNKKDSELNQKTLREVQALAQLDHPNIVRYHSSWLQLYNLPCHHGTLGSESQTPKKSPRIRFKNKVKIQELSSSCQMQEVDESSGGIVFEDSISHKQKTEVKEHCILSSLSHKTNKITDVEGFKYFESKTTLKQEKQAVDNYGIEIKSRSKSSSADKSSASYSKNSFGFLTSNVGTSVDEISDEVSFANGRGKGAYDWSLSTSISSDVKSLFKNALVLHRKHSREAHVALFIQMGLCGNTLANWISRRNLEEASGNQLDSVNLAKCIDIFKQILEAVQYIHSKNIVHRDLKPPNIFFTKDRKSIKIGDFGLARNLQQKVPVNIDNDADNGEELSITPFDNFTANTRGVGTAMYAPPEVKLNGSYGEKSDMYNLGIILLELVHPFKTGSERVDSINKLKNHGYLDPKIVDRWPDIASWIMQLTSVNQEQRPTATELLKLLSSHNSSRGHRTNFVCTEERTFSTVQNTLHTEYNSVNEFKTNCDRSFSRLDDLEMKLPESSCNYPDLSNRADDRIVDIINENREKDREIKKLKEENTKLLEMVALLKEQINQTST